MQLIDYIVASKNEITKRYPNVKFVVFMYDEPITDILYPELKKEGISIIDKTDYKVDPYLDKYRVESAHPSGLFWKEVTPYIVEKLNNL